MATSPTATAHSIIFCPACSSGTPAITGTDYDAFFRNRDWVCPLCHHSMSLWRLVRHAFRSAGPLSPGAVSVGLGYSSADVLTLKRDEPYRLRLGDLGVPNEAKVLSLFLTPNGGSADEGFLMPTFQTQSFTRNPIPHEFLIQPHPVNGGSKATRIAILCNWLDPLSDSELLPLVNSIEAYYAGDYQDAIIPACVAVEYKLGSVLRNHFIQFAGAKRVKEFLQDGATFGYQLNPLLPAVMAGAGAPKLRDEVGSKLNWLRGKRNDVAHEHAAVTQDEACDAVVAALFGYQYLAQYGPLLANAAT